MTTYCPPLPARPRGPWFGWGISLLVHACVLAWLVHAWKPAPPPAAPAARMHFVLVAPKPEAAVPSPQPAAATAPASAPLPAAATVAGTPASKDAAPPRPPRSRPVPSTPAPASSGTAPAAAPAEPVAGAASAAAEPAPAAAEPAAADAGADASAPRLDVKAARATARLIEKHRKDGLVAVPRPDPPLQRDDRLERGIGRAHRDTDCKTAYSGMGLLALIPLAKDTLTGTGCRW